MALGTPVVTAEAGPPRLAPARSALRRRLGDFAIEACLFLAAFFSVLITVGIVYVLVSEALPFFEHVSPAEFFTSTTWAPLYGKPEYGILALISGTVVTTVVALTVALPVGSVVAIYLSEYAPARLAEIVKPVLELLSAVPTVVYGYFALQFVTPFLQSVLIRFGVELPIFNMLGAGIVMGVMIIPYVSSLSEDALRAVPMLLREGSYALGAGKFHTSLRIVYPAAFSGIVSAYILAVSRALGETMIVALAAGQAPNFTMNPLDPAATITAFIVQVSQGDPERGGPGYQSIFAAGLTLFVLTLVFNVLSYYLRKRYREAY